MRIAEYRLAWARRDHGRVVNALMDLSGNRLEIGAGTVLAESQSDESADIEALEARDQRVLALLSAAYQRPVSAVVLGNIKRAGREWVRGEICLAQIHLALSRLSKLKSPEDAADFARQLFDRSEDLKRVHTVWTRFEGAAQ